MNDLTDAQLLQAYAERRSESAFAELVGRHIDLVHSAALRMVCDAHLAKDVTQAVFVALAKNAAELADRSVLSGWLHRVAQNIAAQTVRTDVRRRAREQEAAAMNKLLATGSDADWENIAPHLDAALGELSEPDRDAVLLRYFERKSAREMAVQLGISDDAAQKRVSRAVERLRAFFAKRGITVGASGLAVAISANAVQAAPAGLAIAISTAATLTGTTLVTTATATATKAIAMTALQKTIVTATVVVVAGAGIYEARNASDLRNQVQTLQKQQTALVEQVGQLERERDVALRRVAHLSGEPSLRLPAPQAQVTPAPSEDLPATNLYARFMSDQPKLSVEQLASYLKANGRNAASLLAAYRTSSDASLLDEAMLRFPNDPQVAFEAAMKTNSTPEERRKWLDVLKSATPDNALGDYLSAVEHFRSGQTDSAVHDLLAASGKTFQDFSSERYQDDSEAYLAAGYSIADAKTAAGMQLLLPQLHQIKELGRDMIELAKVYQQAGDADSATTALQMTIALGQRYSSPSPGEPTVSQLVGIAVEGLALNEMDPTAPYGTGGQTVQDRLNHLAQQRSDLQERNRQAESIFPRMTDQDWINYRDRWLTFGEENAIRWLIGKYGQS